MNNVGGNLPLLVDPLSKIPGVGLQTALYISWPGLTAISELHRQKEMNINHECRMLILLAFKGGVLFLLSGLQLWNHNKQKSKPEQNSED